MKRFRNGLINIFKKGDMVLLSLCVAATLVGIVMIYAVMGEEGSRNIIIQCGTLLAGIVFYLAITALDIEILAGQRTIMFLFNALIIGLLLVFGVEGDTGNKSWLQLPLLPFNIQPAELCKITFIIIIAKTMSVNQTRISSVRSVSVLVFHLVFLVGINLVISRDMGVSLIFIFIFAAMLFAGGVRLRWFLLGIVLLIAAAPILWEYFLAEYQRKRILALYDPSIDPTGWDVLWQTTVNRKTLQNGRLTGLGLFNGALSDSTLPARHTDSIFSAVGEQLGMFGCLFVLILLMAIVLRVIYIAVKTPDYMNRLICIGIAGMLFFQIAINVGVCLGMIPVIGLALPFISYGGSSIMTSFMAMGFVSAIKMNPAPDISAHYIRPY